MDRETLLDATFHRFVDYLEREFKQNGTIFLKDCLELYSKEELQDVLFEIQEDFDEVPIQEELKECLADAVHYIDRLYKIYSHQYYQFKIEDQANELLCII